MIADIQPPYNGIGLTQVAGFREKVLKGSERGFFRTSSAKHSPRGGYLENIVSREVVENRNSFILGSR